MPAFVFQYLLVISLSAFLLKQKQVATQALNLTSEFCASLMSSGIHKNRVFFLRGLEHEKRDFWAQRHTYRALYHCYLFPIWSC